MTWCQGNWISHKRWLNICQIFLKFSLGNVEPLCMPTPFVLLSPSACAVQKNVLYMKQILARCKISWNAFLSLLKTSLLLNCNNFEMLALFSVLTSESIMRQFVNIKFSTWRRFCGVKIALIIMQMYMKGKKGKRPQLLYITLGFAVLICSSNYCVQCEPCFLRDKAWKQLHYMNNSSDYDVSGNLKC